MTGPRARHGHGSVLRAPDDGAGSVAPSDDAVDAGVTVPTVAAVEPGVVAPSRTDPVARAVSAIAGGPAGRRLATATGFWRAVPVLVLLATAVLAAGVVQKQHCRAEGWSTPDQFWHACYSDIAVLYGSAGLGGPDRPGLTEAAGPAEGTLDPQAARRFFDVSAVVLTVLLAVAVAAVAAAAGRHRWDAAHVALSPVLLTAGLIAYDLLAVALAAVALLLWSRGRTIASGAVLGIAVAAGPPLLVAGIAGVILAVLAGRVRTALTFAGSAVVAHVVVRALLVPGELGGLLVAWDDWRAEPPGYGSLWLVPQLLSAAGPERPRWWWPFEAVSGMGAGTAAGLTLAALVVLSIAAARLALTAPTDGGTPALGAAGPVAGVPVRTFARLSLVLLAGALVTGTSLPIQASLLLLPFVALAGIAWRDALIWAATEGAYFVAVWLYIGGQSNTSRGLPAGFYLVFVLLRLAGIGWLGVRATRALASGPAGAPARPAETGESSREPVPA